MKLSCRWLPPLLWLLPYTLLHKYFPRSNLIFSFTFRLLYMYIKSSLPETAYPSAPSNSAKLPLSLQNFSDNMNLGHCMTCLRSTLDLLQHTYIFPTPHTDEELSKNLSPVRIRAVYFFSVYKVAQTAQ